MRDESEWSVPGEIDIHRLGLCQARKRMVKGDLYQWKIRHGFTEVIGEPSVSNEDALVSAIERLQKKFKSVFNKN